MSLHEDEETRKAWVYEREQDRDAGFWRPATQEEIRAEEIDRAIGVLVFVAFLAVVLLVGAR